MFTVVSTFSGCGGSSLGYQMAGGKVLLAVEWDDNAAETYRANFPDTDIYHGDIAALSVEDVLARTKLQPGELDIFDGSPPCQGFSTAGKRNVKDSRNQLFREYCRLLKGLQPKCFVMENVSGMVKGQMKLIFAEILRELKGCGYRVSAKLLNAMHYGVPQSRERMIFIGVRNDLPHAPGHPMGSTKIKTVRQALENISPSDHEKLSPLYSRYWDQAKRGEAMGKSFADMRLAPDRPAPTIRKAGHLAHWDFPRWLALNEYAALASFPSSFLWTGKREGVQRIGNSVPPLLMKAIATHINEKILHG